MNASMGWAGSGQIETLSLVVTCECGHLVMVQVKSLSLTCIQ